MPLPVIMAANAGREHRRPYLIVKLTDSNHLRLKIDLDCAGLPLGQLMEADLTRHEPSASLSQCGAG